MIYVYIAIGVFIIILLAVIIGLLVKRKKETKKITVENNDNYGRPSDFEQYYEEERNAKVVDTNDYYM